jgi:hypothetical protein
MSEVETLFRPTITALSRYCPIPVVIEPQSIHTFRSGCVGRCGVSLQGLVRLQPAPRPVVSNLNSGSADLIQEAPLPFSYTVRTEHQSSLINVMVMSLAGVYIPL